jgi:hypothetical protein
MHSHQRWALQHPGVLFAAGGAAVAAALLAIQLRMNVAERDHQARAETFRLAMLAQFAPELLERELAEREIPTLPAEAPAHR